MKNVKQKSQSINILKTKHFKEKLLKLMNPGIKKEYELYIQDLIKDLNNQNNIKSLEKNIVEKEEQEKPLIHIDINLIQYIINKSRRTDDDLFILKCFLKNMDFLSFLTMVFLVVIVSFYSFQIFLLEHYFFHSIFLNKIYLLLYIGI